MLTLLGFLKALLLPPFSLTVAAIAGLASRRVPAGLGRWLAIAALGSVYAMSTPLVSASLKMLIQEPSPDVGTGQAIVILAAGLEEHAVEYNNTGKPTVDSLTLERLRYGAWLARAKHLPLLVSGGVLKDGQPAIADIMNEILVTEYGLAPAWVERKSFNTSSNAVYSARMLKQRNIRTVHLVTHAWHMKRARLSFESQGLAVIPAGTRYTPQLPELGLRQVLPSIRSFTDSYYALHEMIGLVAYTIASGGH